jgi:predicted transcriptional regulator with HTH domain
MPRISQQKKERISEQILEHLFAISPNAIFTSHISQAVARDEEFTKDLLKELEGKKLIVKVKKNHQGKEYFRRERWRLSNSTFEIYKRHQPQ